MKRIVTFALAAAMALSLCANAFAASTLSVKREEKATIGLSDGKDAAIETRLTKYGGENTAKIKVSAPEGFGSLRLQDKDILVGEDVIKSVSYKSGILTLKAKFPSDLEEPEDFVVDTLFTGSANRQSFKVRISGTVFLQDSAGPVAPHEFREKKFVVVDFEQNDGDVIKFYGGQLETQDLESGIANLDISYDEPQDIDFAGRMLHCVHFIASPRLDRTITVSMEADAGNCLYEIKNGKAAKVDAKFSARDGHLQFKTCRLGQYVLTAGELPADMSGAASEGNTSVPQVTAPTQGSAPEKANPGTGAYPLF